MPRIPLNMPKMSMTMEVGTVVDWELSVGDPVKNGDVVAVVTTDKVDMDVESTCDGVLVEILAESGAVVPVGQPIAYIDSESDDLLGDLFAAAPAQAPPAEPEKSRRTGAEVTAEGAKPAAGIVAGTADAERAPAPSDASARPTEQESRRIRAVPLARRLAGEAGLDLSTIEPSGPARTIRARDVRDALARPAEPAAPAQRAVPAEPAAPAATPAEPRPTPSAPAAAASDGELLGDARSRRLRVATAQAMIPSAAVPQFTAYRSLDLTRMARARKAALAGVSWTTILLRAYAMTLREYPTLNGSWTDAGVRRNDAVGICLAVDTPKGLLAPVLREPDRLTIKELNRQVKQVADAARGGTLDPAQFGGATGTVSNLGGMGVARFNALLTPPQATALSLGAVGLVPVFDEDGNVQPRMSCEAGLTIDHRVADGADAARALHTMQEFLDDPLLLLA